MITFLILPHTLHVSLKTSLCPLQIMSPRRSTLLNNSDNQDEVNSNDHNTNHINGSDAQLAAIISQQLAQQITTLVSNLLTQDIQMDGNGIGNGVGNHERNRTLVRKGKKTSIVAAVTTKNQKRKTRDPDVNLTTQVSNKKPYTRNFPLCNTCNRHHPTVSACRVCTNCGRYGHLVNTCRETPNPNANQPTNPAQADNPNRHNYGQCYECGDPNHYRKRCPKLNRDQDPPAT